MGHPPAVSCGSEHTGASPMCHSRTMAAWTGTRTTGDGASTRRPRLRRAYERKGPHSGPFRDRRGGSSGRGSLGPSRTTVKAIAELAGVTRPTCTHIFRLGESGDDRPTVRAGRRPPQVAGSNPAPATSRGPSRARDRLLAAGALSLRRTSAMLRAEVRGSPRGSEPGYTCTSWVGPSHSPDNSLAASATSAPLSGASRPSGSFVVSSSPARMPCPRLTARAMTCQVTTPSPW